MKPFGLLGIVSICCLLHFQLMAQEQQEKLDLPGDNFNLYAALKIFQESATLEAFEKSINDESTKINNLDLDGNDEIDYVRVIDHIDGEVHSISLRVAVSKDEDQDVAVFVVQKEKDGEVQIQVIGDEALYGKDYIIEPNYTTTDSGNTPNPGYTGAPQTYDGTSVDVQQVTTYQVAAWPVIRFLFLPSYTIWQSPWHWSYYPSYWRPWRPYYWHYYYGYHYHWNYYYYGHYRRWNQYRFPGWRDRYYGGFRSRSTFVYNRYERGGYRQTYSRPDMAREGSAVFKKDYPQAPSANNRLPDFDNTGRPVTRPVVTNPGTKPVVTNPGTRPVNPTPVTKPGTRPVTKPGTKPVTKPVVTKPVTRPVVKPGTRPVTKPAPVTRPVTRPGVIKPVPKPAGTKEVR